MPGLGHNYGFLSNLNQILDPPMKRKIDELRHIIQYIQGLHTDDTTVYNFEVSDWLQISRVLLDDICELRIEDRIEEKFRSKLRPYLYSRLDLVIAIDGTSKKLTKQLENGKNVLRGFKRSIVMEVIGSNALNAHQKILQYVSDIEDVRIIRVSGRPGVGKTAVVSKIHNHALITEIRGRSSFIKVFWVTTSPSATLEDLQRLIAFQMAIDLAAASDDVGRAKTLLAAMMTNKRRRILLILDLWKDFTLEEIGIPRPTTENGFKLVIICRTLVAGSRFLENYGNEVDNHEIEGLSDVETNSLFADKVGYEKLGKIPEETWRIILEECDCLPLVTVNLGISINKWLQTSFAVKEMSKAMRNAVDRFNFPLDSLKDNYLSLKEATRPYFFFCALYPSQPITNDLIETEDLIRHWICDGLMSRNAGAGTVELEQMNAMMEQGREIVEEIKNAYLLESVYQDEGKTECIKMKIIVRKMAAHISTSGFFIKVGDSRKNTEVVIDSEEVERASVMSNQLEEFGREPKTKLSTLLVRNHHDHNNDLTYLRRLFPKMPNVKVLDLSGTHIQHFPNNFSSLVQLRALRLRNCIHFNYLPDVSSFLELLVLDLSGTRIESLPRGLNLLKKLLRLDISGTLMRDHFPFLGGLLTELTGLQELLMMSSYLWTEEEDAEDLNRLTKLARLEANFTSLLALSKFVGSADPGSGAWPSKFKFCVGEFYLHQKPDENTVVVIGNISTDGRESLVSLPSHNTLHLMFNNNLEMLPLQDGTILQFLTAINISDCGGLVYLLKSTMVSSVPNLQRIVVKRCKKMVALIEDTASAFNGEIFLENLQELVLSQLEQLERICIGRIRCEHLKSISVWECDRLKKVPSIVIRTENNKTMLKGDISWLTSLTTSVPSSNFGEPYTTSVLIEDTVPPKELHSKLTYTDLNDVTRPAEEEKSSIFVPIKIFILCFVVCYFLISFMYQS